MMFATALVVNPAFANGLPDGEKALSSQATNVETQKMYRLYNPNSGEHFYTASKSEKDSVQEAGWRYEGVEWEAPVASETPVYRLYSGTDHHYTMDCNERDSLMTVGWSDEGICWYSDDEKRVPLYRQFNPNVEPSAALNNAGSHNYTTSEDEHRALIEAGWTGEDVGWYGVKAGPAKGSLDISDAKYDYEMEVLNAQEVYSVEGFPVYIKTDNPDPYFTISCSTSFAYVSLCGYNSTYYDDLHLKETESLYYMQPLASGNGYVANVHVEDPGIHELYITEYGKNPDGSANTSARNNAGVPMKVEVLDCDAERDSWEDEMIERYCSEPGMTQLEKMTALCVAFEGGTYVDAWSLKMRYPDAQCFRDAPLFKYAPTDSKGNYLELTSVSGPTFKTYCWDSMQSPATLVRFAKKLGFTDIENLYNKYPYGSDEWKSVHANIQITVDGVKHFFCACPALNTNSVFEIEYLDI